ncbi:MBL fold metallo-hydrolase [Shewanella zhangzhouensis]|uniref:MBL fold metallo-hydrolase n=1 Tax=Shewanella zhangzhouensis TaxID=2864213 RepID=UPI001C66211D|nr:MBL fold metallo-hydrolase [Shewanella zhangzhouensis]QYK06079.1 MBL fold metallo-hydrolase [Shewanella zhangzhouensis]
MSQQAGEASKIKGRFRNSHKVYGAGLGDLVGIIKAYLGAKRTAPSPKSAVPLEPITQAELARPQARLYRLGHSTVLMYLDGKWLLTDPVFSERASPFQWVGPKRFHPSPIAIEALPDIDGVILSHDHYDHLDSAAIKALAGRVKHFYMPLGVGKRLIRLGIDKARITELDWWQSAQLGTIELTATPAQHFSGRGLFDRDSTLWAGWAMRGKQARVFFSGDSGYFPGFAEIGERLGPFDMTLMETGAYNELWRDIHMMPEESLQAHLDVKGQVMVPIHNGTFDLALHDWYEPLEQIRALAWDRSVKIATPIFGEALSLTLPGSGSDWWAQDSAIAVGADAREKARVPDAAGSNLAGVAES